MKRPKASASFIIPVVAMSAMLLPAIGCNNASELSSGEQKRMSEKPADFSTMSADDKARMKAAMDKAMSQHGSGPPRPGALPASRTNGAKP